MAVGVVLHRVNDYDAWRKVYDSVAPLLTSFGVSQQSVHRMAGDPDNVLAIFYFPTVDDARAFFASADVHDAMQRAGVAGEPRIEYFD